MYIVNLNIFKFTIYNIIIYYFLYNILYKMSIYNMHTDILYNTFN